MEPGAGSGTEAARQPALWTPGRVARLLGVSPITLRSWDARYGIGPSFRPEGRQRRYTDADVALLRRMRRLIDEGVRTRDAANAVLGHPAENLVTGTGEEELEQATDLMHRATMAALLDESLAAKGVEGTWRDVAAPVLRTLGRRWERGRECFAVEWALTTEISAALDRYVRPRGSARGGAGVLLAPCPDEQHTLPLEVLRAALCEREVPVVFTGLPSGGVLTLDLASRLDPRGVVLWSMTVATADPALLRGLRERGAAVTLAGPGWEAATVDAPLVNDLAAALTLLAGHDRGAGDD
ncbi:MerR family transcriptional regulator [Prauserella flavalba]|uniref:HTH merR-type domain-containing protein n=1 Tax=Prauserella flavalba TaxID=1477506 RepID=A0A318LM21_9PSEU|nr:MerR family transcriptional regulator [Prauserella flavalba]PXY35401.1 hypothetical protein BA062_07615 [Prauserella flavalba]